MKSKHDDIMKEFRTYFETNQQWETTQTKVSTIRLRKSLARLRDLCTEQRMLVREWAVIKEAELAEKEALRQTQKRQQAKESGDN
jgi:hypothetical protein